MVVIIRQITPKTQVYGMCYPNKAQMILLQWQNSIQQPKTYQEQKEVTNSRNLIIHWEVGRIHMKYAKKANKHAESDIKVNLLKWLFGVN